MLRAGLLALERPHPCPNGTYWRYKQGAGQRSLIHFLP